MYAVRGFEGIMGIPKGGFGCGGCGAGGLGAELEAAPPCLAGLQLEPTDEKLPRLP